MDIGTGLSEHTNFLEECVLDLHELLDSDGYDSPALYMPWVFSKTHCFQNYQELGFGKSVPVSKDLGTAVF